MSTVGLVISHRVLTVVEIFKGVGVDRYSCGNFQGSKCLRDSARPKFMFTCSAATTPGQFRSSNVSYCIWCTYDGQI